jgi:hypothetical protein
MRVYGKGSLAEFLGDRVVYRNLEPLNSDLPTADELRNLANVPACIRPRKADLAYGKLMAALLRAGSTVQSGADLIDYVVYIGDTRMNDGLAFSNICQAGGWPGTVFIGFDQDAPSQVNIEQQGDRVFYMANRWSALADFDHFCRESQAVGFDERTAVVIDVDKTALGARGRNDHVINHVRVEAVRRTVEDILGPTFNLHDFQRSYDALNQSEFHPFTGDNQDYLAYMCLMMGGGVTSLNQLVSRIRSGQLREIEQFMWGVEQRADSLPRALADMHAEIYARASEGDPTPFKAFRRNEYLVTLEHLGCAGGDVGATDLLDQEIVITQEVRQIAGRWQAEGALIFGLSDKPDEASLPSPAQREAGMHAIHQAETHVVGCEQVAE